MLVEVFPPVYNNERGLWLRELVLDDQDHMSVRPKIVSLSSIPALQYQIKKVPE